MAQTKLPTHLAFAPAILLATIALVVYMAFQFVFGDALDTLTMGSLAELETQVSKLANEIVTEAVNVIEPPSRRKPTSAGPVEKKAATPLGEPLELLEFTGQEQAVYLKATSSPDMKATFTIDSDTPVSARLSAVAGDRAGEKSFASGRITLPKPIPVEGRRAFSLYLKGTQLKAVRIAALEQAGDQYIIWEKRDVPAGADWTTVTIPFADCDMWLYDLKSHKYTRPASFSEPKNIIGLRALVQPGQVTGSTATLWIGSISLR
jgi:hypothetical protein